MSALACLYMQLVVLGAFMRSPELQESDKSKKLTKSQDHPSIACRSAGSTDSAEPQEVKKDQEQGAPNDHLSESGHTTEFSEPQEMEKTCNKRGDDLPSGVQQDNEESGKSSEIKKENTKEDNKEEALDSVWSSDDMGSTVLPTVSAIVDTEKESNIQAGTDKNFNKEIVVTFSTEIAQVEVVDGQSVDQIHIHKRPKCATCLALLSPAYIVFCISFIFIAMGTSSMFLHLASYFKSSGASGKCYFSHRKIICSM